MHGHTIILMYYIIFCIITFYVPLIVCNLTLCQSALGFVWKDIALYKHLLLLLLSDANNQHLKLYTDLCKRTSKQSIFKSVQPVCHLLEKYDPFCMKATEGHSDLSLYT